MRRRDFLWVLGGTMMTAPFAAHGQQTLPTVGAVSRLTTTTATASLYRTMFSPYMKELGFEEGRDYRLSIVFTEGHDDRMPALTNQLVAARVSIVLAPGIAYLEAARRATTTIPIVGFAGDMVRQGFVASLAHPGGNITGVNLFSAETSAKQLELLHEAFPAAKRIGVLIHPLAQWRRPQLDAAASRLGITADVAVQGGKG